MYIFTGNDCSVAQKIKNLTKLSSIQLLQSVEFLKAFFVGKNMKTCNKCGTKKELENFRKNKNGRIWNICKKCERDLQREYRSKNPDKIRQQKKEYNKNNKEKRNKYNIEYYRNNKDKTRKWFSEYNKLQRETNPQYKIAASLRCRTRQGLKNQGAHKINSTKNLLGCTWEEARIHIENQFTEGMTWDNYGFYGWHIDHIRPCDPEQQKECFHYTNLQPLWAKDNLSKNAKWNQPT